MVDRITVASFAAVGSAEFYQDRVAPSNQGLMVHGIFSSSGSAKVLVNMFPDATTVSTGAWVDVTSRGAGGAQITPALPFFYIPGFFPYGVRISVDSLTAAGTGKFALTW